MVEVLLYMCDYGTLKLVKVILRKERGRVRTMERKNEAGYIVHINGNVTMKTPGQLIYANKNVKK
jgi:hypothetical protein